MSRTLIPRVALSVLLFLAAGRAAADEEKEAVGDVEGMWSGQLQAGSGELHTIFHISKRGDNLTATMDSPDQGVYGLSCDKVVFRKDTLRIVLSQVGASYEGKLASDGKEITGVWKQEGQSLRLNLSRMNPLLSPRMLTIAFWIPMVFLSAFFLRLACSLFQGELPTWRCASFPCW